MSANGTDGGFANQDFVEQAHEQYAEHKHEEFRADIEATGTKAWLEEELAARSREVGIFGRMFEFRPLGTNEVTDVVERASALDDDEDISAMPALFRDICETLGDHCLDDEMDAEAFGQIPPADLQDVFESLASDDLDPEQAEQIDRFRDE